MKRLNRLLLGVAALVVLAAQASSAGELGKAVVERLGQVEPTPAPSPEAEEKIRLISSFTLQNKPDGDSLITFEAADFGEKEHGSYRLIAIEQYSLIEPKPQARALRDQIVTKLRDLEKDLLSYVELTGPPREPQSIYETGGAGGSY